MATATPTARSHGSLRAWRSTGKCPDIRALEKVRSSTLGELYDIYRREYLGGTITAVSGHTVTFKPGHFFRLIAKKPDGVRKGFVAKARSAAEAIQMIERGEIDFTDIAGYQSFRAENILLFKDVLTDADFFYEENGRINFGKKYEGIRDADGFLDITIETDAAGKLDPVSFHPRKFTKKLLDKKNLYWVVAGKPVPADNTAGAVTGRQSYGDWDITGNSAPVMAADGTAAEKHSYGVRDNIPPESDNATPGTEKFRKDIDEYRKYLDGRIADGTLSLREGRRDVLEKFYRDFPLGREITNSLGESFYFMPADGGSLSDYIQHFAVKRNAPGSVHKESFSEDFLKLFPRIEDTLRKYDRRISRHDSGRAASHILLPESG